MQQWALCSWRSHGTKSTMLESKLRTGTSKTKKMQIYLDEVALFWMSQWTACSPAWRILYHVTASCKGPIGTTLRWFFSLLFSFSSFLPSKRPSERFISNFPLDHSHRVYEQIKLLSFLVCLFTNYTFLLN